MQQKNDSPESKKNVQEAQNQQVRPFEGNIVFAHQGEELNPNHMGYAIGAVVVHYVEDPVNPINPKTESAPASLERHAYVPQPAQAAQAQRQAAQSAQAPHVPAPTTCCTIL